MQSSHQAVVEVEPGGMEDEPSFPVVQWGPASQGYTNLIDWLARVAAKQEESRREWERSIALRNQRNADHRHARIASSTLLPSDSDPQPRPGCSKEVLNSI